MAKKTSSASVALTLEEAKSLSKEALGGKGFHLAQMTGLGLSVPPAVIIPTSFCKTAETDPKGARETLRNDILPKIFETLANEDGEFPLVSARSGAPVSMPGMMDTVLNIGITSKSLPYWKKKLGVRAALDCRRRLLSMFGDVVFEIPKHAFEEALKTVRDSEDAKVDSEISVKGLEKVIKAFEALHKKHGKTLPDTPQEQLELAAGAVFSSWMSARAIEYRRINSISADMGTACVIQRMVFGNLNEKSCTGVAFSRDPSTGRIGLCGEFLENAQGEDVVNGTRTPLDLGDFAEFDRESFDKLRDASRLLEETNKTVQDIEFTVEDGKLYILQSRTAKCGPIANIKAAVDMVKSEWISPKEALSRIRPDDLRALKAPMIAPNFSQPADCQGLPASLGIVTAPIVFSCDEAIDMAAEGKACVLCAKETSPDDLPGIHASAAILTASGGATSHAAVVARAMNKVCVVGAQPIDFIKDKSGAITSARIGSKTVKSGDIITIDGAGGRVWIGEHVPVIPGGNLPELAHLSEWLYTVYPVYKTTCDPFEVDAMIPTLFATYELDRRPEEDIIFELADRKDGVLNFLAGILDLSTFDEVCPSQDKAILELAGKSAFDRAFEAKLAALEKFDGDKSQIRIHLGARHKDFCSMVESMGYTVLPSVNSLDEAKSAPHPVFASPGSSAPAEASLDILRAKEGSCIPVAGLSRDTLMALAELKEKGSLSAPCAAMGADALFHSAFAPSAPAVAPQKSSKSKAKA